MALVYFIIADYFIQPLTMTQSLFADENALNLKDQTCFIYFREGCTFKMQKTQNEKNAA